MIRLTQKRMKIHHASSILPIKNKLFTDETTRRLYPVDARSGGFRPCGIPKCDFNTGAGFGENQPVETNPSI
jgi:hypothetical protein